ncbi:MAG: bifunctional (p)ppGpp synthetase/guanosine-3',5'-bis(diphosphate) 3'-pyrophosphohydrolase [Rhodopirellula sp.]|nr:bifunctional (p)ppGpp synthetase/guanosine-3',5'-bis(diphosphate) 3'-pyrophosphohydrolase [Rhodopirellula sp.]
MNDTDAPITPHDEPGPFYSPLVEKALRVAAAAHRDQTRKASDLPYFQHPASVVLILARCGFDDDELLAAAVLHDTIEDTDCTVESLLGDFPEAVVNLVLECTENKTDESGEKIPWRARKESHITLMKTASTAGRAIVLADKLHNLGSMVFDQERGEELWSRFNASPADVIWYHREIVAAAASTPDRFDLPLTSRLHRLATECQSLIDRLSASMTV